MSNGPERPPIVWHLDSDQIEEVANSPPDRLTCIKRIMEEFETKKGKNLDETLKAIKRVCKTRTISVDPCPPDKDTDGT